MELGFVGTGVMGQAIVLHLLDAGYQVNVYNRTKSKTDNLVEHGAVWHETPKAVANASDLIFTMVGYPRDVEEIYFGENGLFQSEIAGKILVDMTTSTPSLAERIAEEARERNAESLDAPVSGGDLGAKNGTLTIMAGGTAATYEKVQPLFEIFGKTYHLHGEAGKGQHTKMANQIMVAGTMTGMTETLVYAQKAGLELPQVIETLSGGSAENWSLANYGPRILQGQYSPGFFVKHFIKDLGIALDEAAKMGIDLPSTDLAKKMYERLAENGYENDGTQALIKLWWKEEKKS